MVVEAAIPRLVAWHPPFLNLFNRIASVSRGAWYRFTRQEGHSLHYDVPKNAIGVRAELIPLRMMVVLLMVAVSDCSSAKKTGENDRVTHIELIEAE